MIAPDTNVRACPICGHRQHRQDPTGHVCASVLREALRSTTAELDGARASIASLQRDLAASERYGRAAHARGYAFGIRLARALIRRFTRRLPLGDRLASSMVAALAQVEVG